MAGCIIFLPGILGSRLALDGEEIWPPKPGEVLGGYRRIGKLTDARVVAGEPIGSVCFADVYRPLLDELAEIAAGRGGAPQRCFHAFGYDWRIDLREVARDIAGRIDALPEEDRQDIHLVGHSMGVLVLRILLESGLYDRHQWFGRIRTLISLAGPHRGAPAALVRALGLEGSTGLSGRDIAQIAADPRYPSLYQLMPHPGLGVAWNTGGELIDIFHPARARRLGLGLENLRKAAATAQLRGASRRPGHVRYVYLAAGGQDTWIRTESSAAGLRAVAGPEAGDGTVPLWSAIDPAVAHHVVPGMHDSFFRHDEVRAIIRRTLGARAAATGFARGAARPRVSLHARAMVCAPQEPPRLLLVAARPFQRPEGEVVVSFSATVAKAGFSPVMRIRVSRDGAATDHAGVRLPAALPAGFYRAHFEGSHETLPGDEAAFVMAAAEAGQ